MTTGSVLTFVMHQMDILVVALVVVLLHLKLKLWNAGTAAPHRQGGSR